MGAHIPGRGLSKASFVSQTLDAEAYTHPGACECGPMVLQVYGSTGLQEYGLTGPHKSWELAMHQRERAAKFE